MRTVSGRSSQPQRAAHAIREGRFKSQILPIELKSKKGPVQFDADEHIRGDASVEGMGKLRAVFVKEDGSVYFEKPRTTVGWKGLINDPHMDGSFNITKGQAVINAYRQQRPLSEDEIAALPVLMRGAHAALSPSFGAFATPASWQVLQADL